MSTIAERASAEAARAVNAAVRESYDRRRFTVSKFGEHPDGYLHARVVVDGKPFYFHRRFGSWLAPGTINGSVCLKEPESLLGGELGRSVKYSLSEKSAPIDKARRAARAAEEERAKHARKGSHEPDARSSSEAGGDAGLPDEGHLEVADQ